MWGGGITPLIDGMNLVAKEYVTVQHARRAAGALVLSDSPEPPQSVARRCCATRFDVEALSARIEQAVKLPPGRRRAALATMSRRISANHVHRWVANQLKAISD